MNWWTEFLGYSDKEKVQKEREDEEQKKREERERKEREERERKEREERERKARERERKARERVTNDIHRLRNEMEVDARAHYLCAEYYEKWKFFLFVSLLIVGGALAGYEALQVLGWKVPLLVDLCSKKVAIAVFALGAATYVTKKCYNAVADSHVKHYQAERNCQGIVEKAKSLLQRALSSESASSLRDNYDELLHEKKHSSEIRPEQWANREALKK